MLSYLQAKKKLVSIKQNHLLKFYPTLTSSQKKILLTQIESLNINDIKKISDLIQKGIKKTSLSKISQPPVYNQKDKEQVEKWKRKGLYALKKNQVTFILMAGGQGTRLGHSGPKGTLNVSPQKSIFSYHAKQIRELHEKKYLAPWYIITSSQNDKETKSFFTQKNFFGIDPKLIFFVTQENLPSFDKNGLIYLTDKKTISQNPNGNGRIFHALNKQGILKKLKQQNKKFLFVCGVDNIAVKIADPIFIGFHKEMKSYFSSKVIEKKKVSEKVGLYYQNNMQKQIIEYSEIPTNLLNKKDPLNKDKLFLRYANIAINCIDLDFILKSLTKKLPEHLAFKKINHLDNNGNNKKPRIPNGFKIEYFIFDYLLHTSRTSLLETERKKEFVPIKNKTGLDSLASARKWLKENKAQ